MPWHRIPKVGTISIFVFQLFDLHKGDSARTLHNVPYVVIVANYRRTLCNIHIFSIRSLRTDTIAQIRNPERYIL